MIQCVEAAVSPAPATSLQLLRSLLALSTPLALVNLVTFCISIVPLVFVARLDPPGGVLLAAVGLSNSLMKVAGTAAIEGFSSAFDTLGAQLIGKQKAASEDSSSEDSDSKRASSRLQLATVSESSLEDGIINGAPNETTLVALNDPPSFNSQAVGELFQTFVLYEVVLCLPIMVVWLNAKRVFLALGQGPAVSECAQEFLRPLLLGLGPSVISRLIQGWLSIHKQTAPLVLLTCVNLATQILLHVLFIYGARMGFVGAAWAVATNQLLLCASLVSYVCLRGFHRAVWPTRWAGWRQVFIQPAHSILRLALPGAVMVSMEWSVFEVCSLMAGSRSTESLTAVVVLINAISAIFMLPTGLAAGVGVLVAHALGERRIADARRLAMLVIGVALVVGLLPSLLMAFAGSTLVAPLVQGREDILVLLRPIFPYVALQLLADAMQGVLGGVLRGAARQQFAAVANLVSYYVVGIPLAALFMYRLWSPTDANSVFALLLGLLTGSTTCAMLFAIRTATLNWEEEACPRLIDDTQKSDDAEADWPYHSLPVEQEAFDIGVSAAAS